MMKNFNKWLYMFNREIVRFTRNKFVKKRNRSQWNDNIIQKMIHFYHLSNDFEFINEISHIYDFKKNKIFKISQLYDAYWRRRQTKTIENNFFNDDTNLNKINYFHKNLIFYKKMKLIDREKFLQIVDIFLNWINKRKRVVYYV